MTERPALGPITALSSREGTRPTAPPAQPSGYPKDARWLSSRLRPRVARHAYAVRGAEPLVVPAAHRDWLEAAAERVRRRIARAGYAVHGNLDDLVPRWTSADAGPAGVPSADATLDLAVRVLLDEGGRP